MFNVIYITLGEHCSITAETLEEALSICVALFNQNCELLEIQKDNITLFSSCEIYILIDRAVY